MNHTRLIDRRGSACVTVRESAARYSQEFRVAAEGCGERDTRVGFKPGKSPCSSVQRSFS